MISFNDLPSIDRVMNNCKMSYLAKEEFHIKKSYKKYRMSASKVNLSQMRNSLKLGIDIWNWSRIKNYKINKK